MSLALLAIPAGTTAPYIRPAIAAFGLVLAVLRPLLGFGVLAVLAWLFKPLLRGLARACFVLVRPRESTLARSQRRTMRSVVMLNQMARELETQQPNLAAELRLLAARG